MVRFKATYQLCGELEEDQRPWLVGLLIEYHKWEKIATIMYDDKLIRIPARNTQQVGRRYLEHYDK